MSREKYVPLELVRGDQWGKPNRKRGRSPQQLRLDRRMHDAFLRMVTPEGLVPSRGIQAVRQHEQAPWRILARRIEEARQAGVPKAAVKQVIRTLDHWAEELFGPDQSSGNPNPGSAA